MRLVAIASWLAVTACATVPGPSASSIERSEAVPAGYEALGSAHAECTKRAVGEALRGVPVTGFSCSRSTLERALVEQAQARGGTVLGAERCVGRGRHIECSATIARPTRPLPAGAPPDGAPQDDALPATVAARIVIDVVARGHLPERSAHGGDTVAEPPLTPVGQVEVGLVRARCAETECDDAQARAGLREAAGALGASSVVGVRCFALDGERACVATLAALEVDPETDARAR